MVKRDQPETLSAPTRSIVADQTYEVRRADLIRLGHANIRLRRVMPPATDQKDILECPAPSTVEPPAAAIAPLAPDHDGLTVVVHRLAGELYPTKAHGWWAERERQR